MRRICCFQAVSVDDFSRFQALELRCRAISSAWKWLVELEYGSPPARRVILLVAVGDRDRPVEPNNSDILVGFSVTAQDLHVQFK